MAYFNDIQLQETSLFSRRSQKNLERATAAFDSITDCLLRPYYDIESNIYAVAHPFYHATQFLRNSCRMAYGACVFLGALFTGHFDTAAYTLLNMLKLAAATILEVINTALSIVSLATRFMASFFNLGYSTTSVELRRVCFDSDEQITESYDVELTQNVVSELSLEEELTSSLSTDQHNHRTAFRLV